LTLLLIPFYTVNACLLLVNRKLPPFDQILRKIVRMMRNVGQIIFY
jgi:hypothetical protein